MVVPTDIKHIVRDPDVYGGKPCISGHRIAVHDVAMWHRQGQTPEVIAQDYGLSMAEVYAALTYYYEHQAEIDREIVADDELIRERAQADVSPLAQRLRQSRDGQHGLPPHD
jgi:uncharacterized protein (DUF433 family)